MNDQPLDDIGLQALMIDKLLQIAPEVSADEIGLDEDLRDQLEIDSMDVLNYAIALHEALGIDIPETDVPKLFTIQGGVAYLRERLG